MPRLTQEQARALARRFNEVAAAITKYRLDNFAQLSSLQRAQLTRLENRLLDYANDFTDLAINISLADIETALKKLGAVTRRAQKAIKRLKDVRNVIKISASLVTLGAAIVTGNASAIVGALGSLTGLVED